MIDSLEPADANSRRWDLVVVGAGPAGVLAALEARRGGMRVLLLDRHAFPRDKVCGGCLGPTGWTVLEQYGLADERTRGGGPALTAFSLHAGGATVRLPLDGGGDHGYRAVSRRQFDESLVQQAVREGVAWMSGCRVVGATVKSDTVKSDTVRVLGRREGTEIAFEAALLILACGLSGAVLERFGLGTTRVEESAPLGLAATVESHLAAGGAWPGGDEIAMYAGTHGYVGLCRIGDGRLHIAAALDPRSLRAEGAEGAAAVMRRIIESAGGDGRFIDLMSSPKGTPRLTRHAARVATERILVAGDAAAYVEPVTGEGMTWALLSGRLAGQHAVQAFRDGWSADIARSYERAWRRCVGARTSGCRRVSWLLRHPELLRLAILVLARSRRLRRRVVGPFLAVRDGMSAGLPGHHRTASPSAAAGFRDDDRGGARAVSH